jgi:hypothetical protein
MYDQIVVRMQSLEIGVTVIFYSPTEGQKKAWDKQKEDRAIYIDKACNRACKLTSYGGSNEEG